MRAPRLPAGPSLAALLVCLLPCLAPGSLWAQQEDRARLAAQRRALAEQFATEERACGERFLVTACVEDVRARRRAALAPLRERELRLEEAERSQRAAERRAAIASKQAAAASRPAPPPEPESRVRPSMAPSSAASASGRAPRPAPDEAARAEQARQRVQDAQLRQLDAHDTQQRIQRRLAKREASGHKSDPLPVPGAPASSAPR